MESVIQQEDIVIVGAGIAGLATALGLHRMGIWSLVSEYSDKLRSTGFALTMWTNAWKALDATVIRDYLREKSLQIQGFQIASWNPSLLTSDQVPEADINFAKSESHCVRKKDLVEALARELIEGIIRYSSKIVSIEISGNFKLVHLVDGSTVTTKIVLSNISGTPKRVLHVVERTGLDCISCATLKFRPSWNILHGNIVKNNVCVVGDALHPMTPDISQGGCSALEDCVVLARCLSEALLAKPKGNGEEKDDEYAKLRRVLDKYSKETRWRSFNLIGMDYLVGWVQESDGKDMSFLRKKFLSKYIVATVVRMADFDCRKLNVS